MSKLLITREERVLRITLNDTERHNLLDEATARDLLSTLREAGKDRSVGCVLLDAAGPAFCAGVDFDELLQPDALECTAIQEHLFTFGVHYHKPIVAAVQGATYGGGVALLANCQVVLAAQGSTFSLNEIRAGSWPFIGHRAIALAIGERRTVELSLTGRLFSTTEAQQYGLIHEITPPFELDDRATTTAQMLSTASQETLRRGLDFVQKSREMSWDTAGRLAAEFSDRTFRSADFTEGARAYRDKRKPAWPSLHVK